MAKKLKQQEIISDVQELEPESIQQNTNADSDLDSDFEAMQKNISSFTPESDEQHEVEQNPKDVVPTMEQQIKIKMFVGLMCYLLAGLNMILLNIIRKTKVPFDKMTLTDDERDSILPYLNSVEILQFIDKLPTWLIGVVHVETMFFMKHNTYVDEYKIIKEDKKLKQVTDKIKTQIKNSDLK